MSETEQPRIFHEPEFDGGSFTIDFLSDKPEGFEFCSRESLRRRRGEFLGRKPEGGLIPLPLSDEQKAKVKAGMAFEVSRAKEDAKVENIDPHSLSASERQKYLDAFRATQKVSLRNIRLEGNLLTADTLQVPFPFYRNINKSTESYESLDLANLVATALILETADGKLVVQHRGMNNTLYKDIPGASVAGQFDKPQGPHKPGTLPEITTDSIKDNVLTEMKQEIGLDPDDIGEVRLTGLATDKVAVHNEFLLFAKAKLTSEQIEEKAKHAPKDKIGHDFDENFFVINGDPESLRKLLTEVKCPLPSTHTAAFVAAWYSQMLERMPSSEAKLNLKLLEEDIKKNYQIIDMLVRANNPDAEGFDPAKAPQDQGLPSIKEELERMGLT